MKSTADERKAYALEQIGDGLRNDILERRFRQAFGGRYHYGSAVGALIRDGLIEEREGGSRGVVYYEPTESEEDKAEGLRLEAGWEAARIAREDKAARAAAKAAGPIKGRKGSPTSWVFAFPGGKMSRGIPMRSDKLRTFIKKGLQTVDRGNGPEFADELERELKQAEYRAALPKDLPTVFTALDAIKAGGAEGLASYDLTSMLLMRHPSASHGQIDKALEQAYRRRDVLTFQVEGRTRYRFLTEADAAKEVRRVRAKAKRDVAAMDAPLAVARWGGKQTAAGRRMVEQIEKEAPERRRRAVEEIKTDAAAEVARLSGDADTEKGNVLVPNGHKKGCPCPICGHTRNNPKRRAVKRNHGYEVQQRALVRIAKAQGAKRGSQRSVVRNGSVRIGGGGKDDLGCLQNPAHYPVGKAGRPGKPAWWIIDMFRGPGGKDGLISTSIEKWTKTEAHAGARTLPGCSRGGHKISKVELSGPYPSKPSASTARK